jgi:hypothetical protein
MTQSNRSNDATSPNTADDGRDQRGRFTAGNRGGPGNPFARRVAHLRSVLLAAVTDDDLENIAGQLVVQAKAGDLVAIKLLFQYILGKPVPTVDPDTLDLQELEQYKKSPNSEEVRDVGGRRMPPGPLVEVLRETMPCVADFFIDEIFVKRDDDYLNLGEELEYEPPPAAPAPRETNVNPRPTATTPLANGGAARPRPPAPPIPNGDNNWTAPPRPAAQPSARQPRG